MIDWHSHILPELDDGSNSVQMSVQMLQMLAAQGVECVVATPHFIADDESVDAFLKRRGKANKALEGIDDKLPAIMLGAEVKYYNGISRLEGLERLCIDGTKLLLLEMPLGRWTEYTVRELEEITATKGITVVLAHVERYFSKNSFDILHRLCASGILMQVSAGCFKKIFARKKAFRLLECSAVRFIGTDCHNVTTRAPDMNGAVKVIEKKYGKAFIDRFNEYGRSVLENNT